MRVIEAKCEWCQKEFVAQRKSARFCGQNCRVASHREILATKDKINAAYRLIGEISRKPNTIDDLQNMRDFIERLVTGNY